MPSPFTSCDCKKKVKWIMILLVAIIGIVLVVCSYPFCLLFITKLQNNQESLVRPPYLANGGFNRYAIEYGRIDSYSKRKISVVADRKERFGLHTNVTLVLMKEIELIHTSEQLRNSSLTTGFGINEVYSFSNFLYEANITIKTKGNFSISIIGSDIFGDIFLNDTDNITVCDTCLYLAKNYSSQKSGYYQVIYDVPSEVEGMIVSRLSYDKIDVAKTETSKRKCTITKRKNCTLDIHVDSDYAAVIILQYVISENFFVIFGVRKSVLYMEAAIPSFLIIILLICCICGIYCYRKTLSLPISDTHEPTSDTPLLTNS